MPRADGIVAVIRAAIEVAVPGRYAVVVRCGVDRETPEMRDGVSPCGPAQRRRE